MVELPLHVPGEPPLNGTLALPDHGLPAPAVLIASGSGPLDRDSNHRRARFDVARQLAHALAAGGLASLRYDKRGVGESPRGWRRARVYDNVDDLGRAPGAPAGPPQGDPGPLPPPGHRRGGPP